MLLWLDFGANDMNQSQSGNLLSFLAQAISSPAAKSNAYGPLELTLDEAKRLCQHSLDIVCITNFSGQILWSNGVECKITGFSKEELQKLPMMALVHPDDMKTVLEGLKDVAVGKLHPCTEIRHRCKDGSYKWISWSGVPFFQEQKIYAIGRDITAQRMAESQVRKLAAIVEACTEAIFGIDAYGYICSWNKGAEKIYGYKAEEVLNKSFDLLLPSGSMSVFKLTGDGKTLESFEETHKRKDGLEITASISCFPVPNDSGQADRAAIVRDVTIHKEAEKAVSEFYSITSHELRTPLSAVKGVLSLLDNNVVSAASEQGRELIKMARSSCDRLVRLVNDILDLRRIEAGSIYLDKTLVSSSELLFFALNDIKVLARESDVSIDLQENTTGFVLGDKDRLTQVLTNLLSNALKYSSRGEKIILRTEQGRAGNIRFSVIDNGPGIDHSQMDRLFRKFGQLDSSDSRAKDGLGLGLFVARSIVEKHDGKIGVGSSETGGSQFWFELNLVEK